MDTAQDLGRVREVQGAGMVDALAAVTRTAGTSPSAPTSSLPPAQLSSRVQQLAGDQELGRQRVASGQARGETAGAVSMMFCYSHQDEVLLDELKTHLSPLRRQGKVDMWWDRRISPGERLA